MKKTIVLVFFLMPLFIFSQEIKNEDLIGKWSIIKSEMYLDANLVRKAYVAENKNDTIIEGPQMGEMDVKFDQFIKLFESSSLVFGENGSFTWDIHDETFKMTDKYWTILPQTGIISVTESKVNNMDKGRLIEFSIVSFDGDKLTLDISDSGMQLKFYAVRKK